MDLQVITEDLVGVPVVLLLTFAQTFYSAAWLRQLQQPFSCFISKLRWLENVKKDKQDQLRQIYGVRVGGLKDSGPKKKTDFDDKEVSDRRGLYIAQQPLHLPISLSISNLSLSRSDFKTHLLH